MVQSPGDRKVQQKSNLTKTSQNKISHFFFILIVYIFYPTFLCFSLHSLPRIIYLHPWGYTPNTCTSMLNLLECISYSFLFFFQLSLVTLKLFDTLLQKDDEHIMHNLVLRNLLGRNYYKVSPVVPEEADSAQDKGDNSKTPNDTSLGKEGNQEFFPWFLIICLNLRYIYYYKLQSFDLWSFLIFKCEQFCFVFVLKTT